MSVEKRTLCQTKKKKLAKRLRKRPGRLEQEEAEKALLDLPLLIWKR